jgi:hypothetical protein
MLAHVNPLEDGLREGESGPLDGLRGPDHAEDRAVVIGIAVQIREPSIRNRADGLRDGLDHARIPPFAHVRDALEERARHGPV